MKRTVFIYHKVLGRIAQQLVTFGLFNHMNVYAHRFNAIMSLTYEECMTLPIADGDLKHPARSRHIHNQVYGRTKPLI